MLSVASAAHPLFDHESQPHSFFSIPDVELASLNFPNAIFEPITPVSNQTSPNSAESNHVSIEPVSLESTERKLKRMKSNRESARRSRMRKQNHLHNLRNEVNRLSFTNQELSNRLRFVHHIGLTTRSENQRLRTEHSVLRQRLIELQNVLIFRQITQMNDHKNNIVGGFGYVGMNEPMGI